MIDHCPTSLHIESFTDQCLGRWADTVMDDSQHSFFVTLTNIYTDLP